MVKQSLFILLFLLLLSVTVHSSEYGYLYLESTPDSAEFFIDGSLKASFFTPRLCTLLVGSHAIRLYKPFYRNASLDVIIKADQVTRSSVALQQSETEVPRPGERSRLKSRFGRLTVITTPPNATIYIDNKLTRKATPTTIENLEVGRREIRLELDRLQFIDTLLILPDTTLTLQLSHDEWLEADRIRRSSLRIPIDVVIKLPGCAYRWEKRDKSKPEIDGVDPIVKIEGLTNEEISLNHETFPATNQEYDRDLQLVYKEMPDTSYQLLLEAIPEQKIRFKVDLVLDERNWLLKRTKPQSVHKEYSVPADFNSGRPISVRITILENAEVLFRYF